MRRWAGFVITILVGCANDLPDPTVDARPRDTGARDAAETADAGETGDATPDTGPLPDTGAPQDGSITDAADAGPPDTGLEDTGAVDAGAPDTGISIPLCQQTCSTPAECTPSPPQTVTDTDNYDCMNNVCSYRGCNTDPECVGTFGPGYVCVQHPNAPLPACVQACTVPADCALASPLFDEDNYACTSGGCEWLGCNAASECQAAFMDASYVCEMQPNLSFPNCIKPCATPADCGSATPAFDADNYACNNQRCEYLGCMNNLECTQSFPSGTYECR